MIAQLLHAVFGGFTPAFYVVAIATALILMLAATAFGPGFPVLASVLAQDRYLPRHTHGDRLAFSNGIVFPGAGRDRVYPGLPGRGHRTGSSFTSSACSCRSLQPGRDGPALDAVAERLLRPCRPRADFGASAVIRAQRRRPSCRRPYHSSSPVRDRRYCRWPSCTGWKLIHRHYRTVQEELTRLVDEDEVLPRAPI